MSRNGQRVLSRKSQGSISGPTAKLCQMMQFLKQTVKDKLILRADGSGCLK